MSARQFSARDTGGASHVMADEDPSFHVTPTLPGHADEEPPFHVMPTRIRPSTSCRRRSASTTLQRVTRKVVDSDFRRHDGNGEPDPVFPASALRASQQQVRHDRCAPHFPSRRKYSRRSQTAHWPASRTPHGLRHARANLFHTRTLLHGAAILRDDRPRRRDEREIVIGQ
jgi:hypothetical protein